MTSEALFRYQIVSMVLTRTAGGESQAEAVRAVADVEHHFFAQGDTRRISTRSIYRWLEAYNKSGLPGLTTTRPHVPGSSSGVLSADLIKFFRKEKKADPMASIPELIRRAGESPKLKDELPCNRVTVYRTLKHLGISVCRRKKGKDGDVRRFSFPHRLDMVLCDGKHFRAGATRARRLAFFFLDDATRFLLHAVVGTSENAALFQRGLFEMVSKYGFFDILYLDKGSGFTADDTIAVVANLDGARLIHGTTAYPQGHGKIERFNRTAKADVLRSLDRRPDVDPDLRALELRIQHYCDTQYNQRGHDSLRHESPAQRFFADEKALRLPEDREALKRKFEVHVERRVSADNIVPIDSTAYEMPRGYDGRKVILRKRVIDGGKIFFLHEGSLSELHPVDLEANARSQRGKGASGEDDEVEHPLPPSAADMAFHRDLGPVASPDGGLPDSDSSDPHSLKEEIP